MPKRYYVIKWAVYAAATALLLLFQLLVVHRIRLWGLTPYLPPILVGAAASFEGRSASPFYAAAFGLLCDLTAAPPVPGFFTLTFTLAALLSSFVTETLFSRDLLGCLVAAAISSALTGAVRVLVLSIRGIPAFAALCSVAAREFLISIPLLVVVFPLFRWVHKKTTFDY